MIRSLRLHRGLSTAFPMLCALLTCTCRLRPSFPWRHLPRLRPPPPSGEEINNAHIDSMQAASSTAQGGVRRGWVRRRQGSGARGRGQAPRASRGDALWRAFEEKVKGEWVGRLAEFEGSTGAPVPIDKIYLPEAYVEWAANLYDWQTHTITETGRETPGKVSGSGIDHKLRVLVPQDSCECFDLEVMVSSPLLFSLTESLTDRLTPLPALSCLCRSPST